MKAALLPDRGVVKVAGDGARNFLHGLVTADILDLAPGSLPTSSRSKRRQPTAAAFFST